MSDDDKKPKLLPPPTVIGWEEVIRRVNLSKSTIRRLMSAGHFPKRYPISARRVGWYECEITEWIAVQASKRLWLRYPGKVTGQMLWNFDTPGPDIIWHAP